jgi:hypothetical protein
VQLHGKHFSNDEVLKCDECLDHSLVYWRRRAQHVRRNETVRGTGGRGGGGGGEVMADGVQADQSYLDRKETNRGGGTAADSARRRVFNSSHRRT